VATTQPESIARAVIKKIFKEIRYPFIQNIDLVSKVASTEMVDPNLYTAALEYHINEKEYRGPASQLKARKYAEIESYYNYVVYIYINIVNF